MNPRLKRLIEKTEQLARQLRNLKSKIRRNEKLTKTLDLLERHRIEAEIELLKKKVSNLRLEELKCSIPIIEGLVNGVEEKSSIEEIDWSKAGRA